MRSICEDIYYDSLKEEEFFPKAFLLQCKNDKIYQNIPSEIKNKIKNIVIEACLYTQVVMIKHQAEVNDIEEGLSKTICLRISKK